MQIFLIRFVGVPFLVCLILWYVLRHVLWSLAPAASDGHLFNNQMLLGMLVGATAISLLFSPRVTESMKKDGTH